MSKIVNALNQIWHEERENTITIGLTRDFLNSLDECWHILPTTQAEIKVKTPLFTLETNDGLLSILSPVKGFLHHWNDQATNFPDKLTENDPIITLAKEAPKTKKSVNFGSSTEWLTFPPGVTVVQGSPVAVRSDWDEVPTAFDANAARERLRAIAAERDMARLDATAALQQRINAIQGRGDAVNVVNNALNTLRPTGEPIRPRTVTTTAPARPTQGPRAPTRPRS